MSHRTFFHVIQPILKSYNIVVHSAQPRANFTISRNPNETYIVTTFQNVLEGSRRNILCSANFTISRNPSETYIVTTFQNVLEGSRRNIHCNKCEFYHRVAKQAD